MIRADYLGNQTDGIFAKLYNKGQITSEYFVSKVTSCLEGNSLIPLGIGKVHVDNYWRSDTNANNYISIEFKRSKVSVNAFSIRGAVNGDHICSFVVEGSNDNFVKSYTLYEQTKLNILNGGITLTLGAKNHQKFKYIRMRSTGTNGFGGYQIVLYVFELFGVLTPDNYIQHDCSCKRKHNSIIQYMMIMLMLK